MKVKVEKKVPFFEVDPQLTLMPRAMLNYFQEAVGIHSAKAGDESLSLMAQDRAWVLSSIGIQYLRLPRLGDNLTLSTWHTGYKGFKAYRDFEIRCNGQSVVAARTVWLFIDLAKKRILRIPKSTDVDYTTEPCLACDLDPDSWQPETKFEPEHVKTIATRPSDYDPLGHVNNAAYFDYLLDLRMSCLPERGTFGNLMLHYAKEIPDIPAVQAGIARKDDTYLFKIFSEDIIHAAGQFTLQPNGE